MSPPLTLTRLTLRSAPLALFALMASSACSGGGDDQGSPDGGSDRDGGAFDDGGSSEGDGGVTDPDAGVEPGTRFASTETNWAIPEGGLGSRGFWQLADANGGTAGVETWSTIDINGDGHVDLVSTARFVDNIGASAWGTAGSRHWRAFLGDGAGFSPTASMWPIPEGGLGSRGFWQLADANGGTPGVETWSTIDINGDDLPDLVSTARFVDNIGASAWGNTGSRHWRVFVNQGDGFSSTATTWPIPEGGLGSRGFWQLADANGGTAGVETWSTIDVNGDELPDLVSTARFVDNIGASAWGNAGSRHWRVFLSSGDGFSATASTWPIPEGGLGSRGFWQLADANGGTAGVETWSTIDINGDALPDLVSTARFVDNIGASAWGTTGSRHWRAFLSDGSGFSSTASTWPIPEGGLGSRGFWQLADANGGTAGVETWSTIDINGDALPDLVSTARFVDNIGASAWGNAGARHWRVFLGDGVGFASSASIWPIPEGGLDSRGFWQLADANGGTAGVQTWSTLDLNGDQRPDLVSTARFVDNIGASAWGNSGARHWQVFLSTP